jgi:hypothetical protein
MEGEQEAGCARGNRGGEKDPGPMIQASGGDQSIEHYKTRGDSRQTQCDVKESECV